MTGLRALEINYMTRYKSTNDLITIETWFKDLGKYCIERRLFPFERYLQLRNSMFRLVEEIRSWRIYDQSLRKSYSKAGREFRKNRAKEIGNLENLLMLADNLAHRVEIHYSNPENKAEHFQDVLMSLDEWHEARDGFSYTELCEDVVAGRTPNPHMLNN